MRLAPSIDDLIEHAEVSWTAPDEKNHKQFAGYFDNYRGKVRIDNTKFDYVVRVGHGKTGEKIFYDVNLEIAKNKEDAGSRELGQKSVSHKKSPTSSIVTIAQKEALVNTQNEISGGEIMTEEEMAAVNTFAQIFGVRVVIVESLGGGLNGVYKNGVIYLAKDAVFA